MSFGIGDLDLSAPSINTLKNKLGADVLRRKSLSTSFEKNPTAIFSSSQSSYSNYFWWFVVDVSRISGALGRYYAYYSTDHDATFGGIAMAYGNTPLGPWTNYGQVFVDTVRTFNGSFHGQTESPSVIMDDDGTLRMFYQQTKAVVNGVNANGVQSTLSATSTDGVTWVVDNNFILDVPPLAGPSGIGRNAGDGHTGYFTPFRYKDRWLAYSLYGSGNYGRFALHHCTGKLNEWITDPRPLGSNQDAAAQPDGNPRRISWNGSSVYETANGPILLATLSPFTSGGVSGNTALMAIGPISSDLRRPTGKMKSIWQPTLSWESSAFSGFSSFLTDNTLYIYYLVTTGGVRYVGVLSYGI